MHSAGFKPAISTLEGTIFTYYSTREACLLRRGNISTKHQTASSMQVFSFVFLGSDSTHSFFEDGSGCRCREQVGGGGECCETYCYIKNANYINCSS